jgi:hypothetical protein
MKEMLISQNLNLRTWCGNFMKNPASLGPNPARAQPLGLLHPQESAAGGPTRKERAYLMG